MLHRVGRVNAGFHGYPFVSVCGGIPRDVAPSHDTPLPLSALQSLPLGPRAACSPLVKHPLTN